MIPSDADLQRYLRIFIYYGSGWLSGHGLLSETWTTLIGGVVIALATLFWSKNGMSIRAKLNEMAKLAEDQSSPVKAVILTKDEKGEKLAADIVGPVVTEGTAQARKLAA